jgi:8-oxo-dGTP pyrophosphatase MutT (NUDIX family)
MDKIKSCGVVVFRRDPALSFLLLRHPHRYDLPKGHVEEGEAETECALRELAEETGLTPDVVRLEDGFRWATTYYPRYRGRGGRVVEKTVVIFLGWLLAERHVALTEHTGYEWVLWRPPHRLAQGTIDGVLAAVEKHFNAFSLQPQQPPG